MSLKDKWSHNEQSSPIGYQVKSGGITRELDKEPLLHYSSIYTTTSWSMLQQCVYLISIHHATTSCPITHPHVFSIRPPCFLHVPWHHTFNLRYICAHYVYTMRNPYPLMSLLTLTPSRLFPILLDHYRLYHMTSRSRAYLLYLFSHCRLIIITTIYTCPNPNPSPSLSTCSIYNTYPKGYILSIRSTSVKYMLSVVHTKR